MAGRYDQRVRDLIGDAEASAAAEEWGAVRDLAGAVLALSPDHPGALALLERAESARPPSGERRQLTVMFCDIVGSTALSQEHDPELVREVLRSYQVTCDRVVRRYEGRIARFIGDGVLAYFGHPVPHEDDARRGVKAGVDLLDALRPVVEEAHDRYGVDLRIRVAVHTGLVVRADMGSVATPDRDAIVGDTPNIAARLQDHAEPGSLLISHGTYELVRPWFLVAPRGPIALKGIDEPVRAYAVVAEAPEDSLVPAQVDLSPFVGRAVELDALLATWDEVRRGGSHAVAITGPPGVGKTRLADVLRRRVEADDGVARLATCSSFHRSTALHPVRRLLERVAGIEPHQEPEVALAKLWSAMEAVGQADALPVVATLLELPATPWCPAPELEGPKLREQLLAALEGWIRAAAARAPILYLVDDLQWADPSTHELLVRIIGSSIPRVLIVATLRDDTKVPWASATVLTLDRLLPDELGELARRSPEGRRLPSDHVAQLIERSDGVPLFLEELLRNAVVANGGTRPGATSTIPSALRDLLLARFAAPGVDLHLAQLLATIGHEAPRPLVAAVARADAAQLDLQLGALVEAGIVELVPGDPPSYRFRHQLLAELAYDTQLQAARREAHGAVADALQGGAADLPAAVPAVLAHHLQEADRPAEAIRCLTAAAEAAHRLGANAEVADLLARALALLDSVPGDERARLEFEVRLVRATNAASILGFAAPQAVEDHTACQRLVASQVGSSGYLDDDDAVGGEEHMWSASALWANLLLQGNLAGADQVNRDLVAQLRPGGSFRRYFETGPGYIVFFSGDYPAAVEQLDAADRLLPDTRFPSRLTVPSDPRVTNKAHLAHALAARCRFPEARDLSDSALELAGSVEFPVGPFSHCYVLSMRASLEAMADDLDAVGALTDRLTQLADRHGFTFWSIVGGYYAAYRDLRAGVDGAAQRCSMSLMLLQGVGVRVWLPYFHASVAAALLRAGDTAAALDQIRSGQSVAEGTGAHYWSAELSRLEGAAAIAAGDARGDALLRSAVERAIAQGATLHELWARTSLCERSPQPDDRAALAELVDRVASGTPPASVEAARAVLA